MAHEVFYWWLFCCVFIRRWGKLIHENSVFHPTHYGAVLNDRTSPRQQHSLCGSPLRFFSHSPLKTITKKSLAKAVGKTSLKTSCLLSQQVFPLQIPSLGQWRGKHYLPPSSIKCMHALHSPHWMQISEWISGLPAEWWKKHPSVMAATPYNVHSGQLMYVDNNILMCNVLIHPSHAKNVALPQIEELCWEWRRSLMTAPMWKITVFCLWGYL